MGVGPTIDPADVGVTGLAWLFFSYGYALFYAANLIGEGSELLLLVPSLAGLVGGVVLPLLGAVPDGAIILFSGLGSIEVAQESLSVGIGALAGSTIMLLTVPWALSIFAGRVDINKKGNPSYRKSPKVTPGLTISETLHHTGVSVSDEIHHGGFVMALTTIPYFLIQIPAMFMHGPTEEVAKGEHWYALAGLIICIAGLFFYMRLQLKNNNAGQNKDKRIAIAKKTLQQGKMSLAGIVKSAIKFKSQRTLVASGGPGYGAISSIDTPTPEVLETLKELLYDAFCIYDSDKNGKLEKKEIRVFLKDFHEHISEEEIDNIWFKVDENHDNNLTFDEFVSLCYYLIMGDDSMRGSGKGAPVAASVRQEVCAHVFGNGENQDEENDEVEEIPEEFTDLSPEEQQKAIKMRAFKMLFIGTVMVVYFSDPMVDVMQEIAVKANIAPFYVSFVLAPLASNSSEVVASMFYAAKKTRKTMTVSLSALEGAACMNNTFCLCIFMGLIYARGLAWQYTAETTSIVIVEFIMALLVQKKVHTSGLGVIILSIFPLSLLLVFTMEQFGFD